MKLFLSQTILPLRGIWPNFAHDVEFRRKDYALILGACRASSQGVYAFIKQAALQYAQFILQPESSGRRQ